MAQQEYGIPELSKAGKFGIGGIVIILILLIAVWKSSVNIGYGEAGVLFKTLGEGVVTDEPAINEGFHILHLGTR